MLVKINTFKGMFPAIEAQALENNAAQTATNVDFSGGTLRPMLLPGLVGTIQLDRVGTTSTMYRYMFNSVTYWLKWVAGEIVNLVLSPVPNDAYGRAFWTTSAGKPQYSFHTAITTGGGTYPNASYDLGIVKPVSFAVAAVGIATSVDPLLAEDRAYVVTFVEAIGGAPSFEGPPSSPVKVRVKQGETVNLSGLPAKPGGANLVAYKRIYRTNTGSTGTAYQLVDTIDISATTYADVKANDALAEVLPSTTWTAPPPTLQGLISLPSGAFAGFVGNTVSFSVPFLPHAWPAEYQLTVDYPILSIAAFGSGLLVLTRGNPYVINGTTPGSMAIEKLEIGTACMSAKGVVDFGDFVVYPSTRGLMAVGVQGVRNLTEGMTNQQTWNAIHPATAVAAKYDSFYIAWTDNTQVIFNTKTGDYSFHDTGLIPACVWTDPVDGTLYLAKAAVGNDELYSWVSGAKGQLTWKSKKIRSPIMASSYIRPISDKPTNMAAARVIADSYAAAISCKIYADGVLKHTQAVTSSNPFRLPSGFVAREWEIEITATTTIFDVSMATSITELTA